MIFFMDSGKYEVGGLRTVVKEDNESGRQLVTDDHRQRDVASTLYLSSIRWQMSIRAEAIITAFRDKTDLDD